MNFEKAWNALVAAISAENNYHEFKKAEIALLMLRCLADPDQVLREVEIEAAGERKVQETAIR